MERGWDCEGYADTTQVPQSYLMCPVSNREEGGSYTNYQAFFTDQRKGIYEEDYATPLHSLKSALEVECNCCAGLYGQKVVPVCTLYSRLDCGVQA